jgi:uncharacterized protein YaaN involved in tellurite resistance
MNIHKIAKMAAKQAVAKLVKKSSSDLTNFLKNYESTSDALKDIADNIVDWNTQVLSDYDFSDDVKEDITNMYTY